MAYYGQLMTQVQQNLLQLEFLRALQAPQTGKKAFSDKNIRHGRSIIGPKNREISRKSTFTE